MDLSHSHAGAGHKHVAVLLTAKRSPCTYIFGGAKFCFRVNAKFAFEIFHVRYSGDECCYEKDEEDVHSLGLLLLMMSFRLPYIHSNTHLSGSVLCRRVLGLLHEITSLS